MSRESLLRWCHHFQNTLCVCLLFVCLFVLFFVCLFVCLFVCSKDTCYLHGMRKRGMDLHYGGRQNSKFKYEHFKDCLQRFTLIRIRILELYNHKEEHRRRAAFEDLFCNKQAKSMPLVFKPGFSFRQTDSGVRNTMLVLRFLHDLEHHLDAMNSQKIGCLGNIQNDGMALWAVFWELEMSWNFRGVQVGQRMLAMFDV